MSSSAPVRDLGAFDGTTRVADSSADAPQQAPVQDLGAYYGASRISDPNSGTIADLQEDCSKPLGTSPVSSPNGGPSLRKSGVKTGPAEKTPVQDQDAVDSSAGIDLPGDRSSDDYYTVSSTIG